MKDKIVKLRSRPTLKLAMEKIKPEIPEGAYVETFNVEASGIDDEDFAPKGWEIKIRVNGADGRRDELLEVYERIRVLIPEIDQCSFGEEFDSEWSYLLSFSVGV